MMITIRMAMISASRRSFRQLIVPLVTALLLTVAALPAHAYYYTGGDWGGADLSLLNGDSLSGSFSNVGKFYIPTGATISGAAGNLVINANSVLIDGSLTGLSTAGYNLNLFSQTNLILNGSLSSWNNISLSANQISSVGTVSADGTISLLGGTSNASPPINGTLTITGRSLAIGNRTLPIGSGPLTIGGGAVTISSGGDIALAPTPIPAAALLFGSGLAGLAGLRRSKKTFIK